VRRPSCRSHRAERSLLRHLGYRTDFSALELCNARVDDHRCVLYVVRGADGRILFSSFICNRPCLASTFCRGRTPSAKLRSVGTVLVEDENDAGRSPGLCSRGHRSGASSFLVPLADCAEAVWFVAFFWGVRSLIDFVYCV